MKLNRTGKFLIAVFIQLAILSGIITHKYIVFKNGVDVVLKIKPVDPRDPLRGDYLIFRYDISSMPIPAGTKNGDSVYVVLNQSGKYWSGSFAYREKPMDPNIIFIKGKVLSGGITSGAQDLIYSRNSSEIVYGIENYFIPEGKGNNFNWRSEPYAQIKVNSEGNAILKQIYINDKPWP